MNRIIYTALTGAATAALGAAVFIAPFWYWASDGKMWGLGAIFLTYAAMIGGLLGVAWSLDTD